MIRCRWRILLVVTLASALLAGCKVELNRDLTETEANQIMALLLLRSIPAEKKVDKGGSIVMVDKNSFIDAVEVLRQNGLPKPKFAGMEDVFPSNQLISSPTQERAKINFLKEQQLSKVLSSMDGVVSASVSIARQITDDGKTTGTPSAAVFIKYSPEFNLANSESEIRGMIRDGVPDIKVENVSVVMQPATYRYTPTAAEPQVPVWKQWILDNVNLAAGIAAGVGLLLASLIVLIVRRTR